MCMYNVHVKIQGMYKATIKGLYVYTCAGINPMDNLKISELRIELERRGLSTAKKRKPELERDFDELRRGIVNVPALLQGSPETPLTNLHLDRYEISPVEPLHDVKGHLSNLIDEIRAILTGEAKERVDAIANSVLGKETLRGSDFRKGAILMLKALQDILPNSFVTTTLSTAVEITELLYSRPHKRTQQSMLRLHNLSFVHAKLCSDHLSNPKKMSQRKMFGRYFHAITAHSPLLYRIITPRLLNTEVEERVFGQCKAITRSTSNQHTSNIITNLLVRMHYEQKRSETKPLQEQESEVFKLAKTLPAKINTVITFDWMENSSIHYQAHLERISDYLLHGPGVWWQYVHNGVEFFDAVIPKQQVHVQTQPPHHFRSSSLGDVDEYLLSNWEQCLDQNVQLPARHIRTYQTHTGGLNSIISAATHRVIEDCESTQTHLASGESPQMPTNMSLTPCTSGTSTQTPTHVSLTLCTSGRSAQTPTHVSLTPCTSGTSAQTPTHVSLTPCTSGTSAQTPTHVSLTPCTSGTSAQTPTHVSLTPCTSGTSTQTPTHVSLTSCTSGTSVQTPTHVSLTPCTSGTSAQTPTHVSLTPCTSGTSTQTPTHVSLTPCTSGTSVQMPTHVSLTPCTSGTSAPTQATHLPFSPCSAKSLKQLANASPPHPLSACNSSRQVMYSSNTGPYSSIGKSLVQVTPSSIHNSIQEFDQLRQKVKFARARKKLCSRTLGQYERVSNNLKQQLLNQLQRNSEKILELKDSECSKQLQHKNNVLKKILAHEWNTSV